MTWHKIPHSAIDSKKAIQQIKLAGKDFCLIYHEEKWHATSIKCPHAGANFTGGWCENGRLICPYHRHSFALGDGKGALGQYNAITIYRLEQKDSELYIELPESIFTKLANIFK
ncbi:Rieske (2Fe-2S) protein [Sphingobacterium bovistauri]|uniref:Rieske (2Fe-2S) protein n=1 Tax=Sphingobacterium bovistauri TaxID=2781959 RepID=A0ABS7Z7D7_9SPHI|nr:Rieske (2Fe-2S) protein [Sphingobacterium bovistauri]MCA5004780.1 Rieske (2Fe-2S) protein [Sphingobacterium bovistauri]